MAIALRHVDDFLRGTGRFLPAAVTPRPWWWLPLIIVCFGPIYGGFMGSYHFVSPDRIWQIVFSGVKMPLLLGATTLLCLPAFWVLNTVLGLRDDLGRALQAVLAGQAGLSVTLASLAPMTRFWYFSVSSYRGALLFNVAMFAVATIAGYLVTFRYYRPLIEKHAFHRIAIFAWFVLYAFTGIQMGWTLRPFVGSPDLPASFFRAEPFSNAYVVVTRLIFGG